MDDASRSSSECRPGAHPDESRRVHLGDRSRTASQALGNTGRTQAPVDDSRWSRPARISSRDRTSAGRPTNRAGTVFPLRSSVESDGPVRSVSTGSSGGCVHSVSNVCPRRAPCEASSSPCDRTIRRQAGRYRWLPPPRAGDRALAPSPAPPDGRPLTMPGAALTRAAGGGVSGGSERSAARSARRTRPEPHPSSHEQSGSPTPVLRRRRNRR